MKQPTDVKLWLDSHLIMMSKVEKQTKQSNLNVDVMHATTAH